MVKWFVLGAVAVSTAGCGGLAGLVGVSVNVVATPPTIANGQSTTLAWQSIGASSVVSSNFGAVSVSGSKVVSPSATTVYTVTVQDSSGNPATNTATVTVN
jgi:hypothetical protein